MSDAKKATDQVAEEVDWLTATPVVPRDQLPAVRVSHALQTALWGCTPQQRTWLRAFVAAGCVARTANKHLREAGLYVPASATVAKWQQMQNFNTARELLVKHALSLAGLDANAIGLRLSRLVEDCSRLEPYTDKQGNSFLRPVDAGTAHAALRTLAGMAGAMQSPGGGGGGEGGVHITFQVIGASGKPAGRVFEGTAERVPVEDQSSE